MHNKVFAAAGLKIETSAVYTAVLWFGQTWQSWMEFM
jgi:hypothetical protein